MFDLFARKSDVGPVLFEASVDIDRPPDAVYALLDWADPMNAKRQLGQQVHGGDGRFEVVVRALPDLRFGIAVTDAVPCRHYAYRAWIDPPVGRLVIAHESYRLAPLDDGRRTRLSLCNESRYLPLTRRQAAEKQEVKRKATSSALAKIKILAEQGVEAALQVEDRVL